MKVLLLCADSGIAPDGTKGASLHLRALARALEKAGHALTLSTRREPAAHSVLDVPWRPLRKHDGVRRVLEKVQPDLIVERYSLGHTEGMDAARSAQIPYALEVNSPLVLEASTHRAKSMCCGEAEAEQRLWIESPHIFAVSNPLVAAIAKVRGHSEGLHLLRNGCDLALHPHAARSTPGAPRLVFLGHPKPWHGTDALVPLMLALRNADCDASLRIIGGGPGAEAVLAAAAAAGLAEQCSATGALDEQAAARELEQATLMVAPYPPTDFFWFCPLKLIQSAVAGVPVVTTALGDIPDIVGPGGICVAAGDSKAFAAAVLELLRDPARCAKLAADARQRGLALFSWDEVAARLLNAVGAR